MILISDRQNRLDKTERDLQIEELKRPFKNADETIPQIQSEQIKTVKND